VVVIGSLTRTLDNPNRQALVPGIVGREHLTNAIALNAVAIEVTVIVDPALGVILISTVGMSGTYAMIAAVYACSRCCMPVAPYGFRRTSAVHGLGVVWRRTLA